jgi:GGDEF domain-containing protein
VPVGASAVLVLAFADRDPGLQQADWWLLETIARQVAAALERVDALQRVRELSLRDPETGVGNRRLLEILLEHSFAQAQRGAPLTLVGILPGLGGVGGDPAADSRLASLLLRQVRGADVVARVEEGVFVVVLQSSSAAGAGSFLRRLMQSEDGADLRFALAEQDGRYDDSNAMLQSVLAQMGVSATLN